MSITKEQLQGLAAQSLNLVKADMLRGRWKCCLIATWHEGKQLYRMRKIEALLNEKLGEDWLNSGEAKDIGFGLLRAAVMMSPPDAVIWATVINKFEQTEKFDALPMEDKKRWIDGGHDRQHEAVRQGLLTVHDAVCAIAQSPEWVCIYTQRMPRLGLFVGHPEVNYFPQAQFDGRMKLYGTGKHQAPMPDFTRKTV